MRFQRVPTTVAVASGKGGVGKTFVSVELAKTLSDAGAEVGILDVDLTTPDSDRAAAAEPDGESGTDRQSPQRDGPTPKTGHVRSSSPIEVDGVQVVTKGTDLPDYAVNTNDERMQLETVMGFIREADWNDETTHVVIDTPPGTGWEIQTVLRELQPDFGFIVTTGSVNAVRNACRTHELFRRVGLDHAVIANMRRAELTIDPERLRDRVGEIDAVDGRTRDEIVETVLDSVAAEDALHDDGLDLSDHFSVPIVADLPFTADSDRVRDELRQAIARTRLTAPVPE